MRSTGGHRARKEGPTNAISVPLGPYHPALPQPFGLTVKLRGETMESVKPPRAGYCAREIQSLACGKPVTQALALMERSCALAGHTYRTAACQAIERALSVAPSPRTQLVRAAFAEIERLLARLWTLGLSARAAGLDSLWRAALDQRETVYVALYRATGQRGFWSIAVPGGVCPFDPPLDGEALCSALASLEPALASWRAVTGASGPLGRVAMGAGILDAEHARALKVTGIAARGAGVMGDPRCDAPDGAYAAVADAWPVEPTAAATGDGAARLVAAAEDLLTSARLARGLLEAARDAEDMPVVLDVAVSMARLGIVDGVAGSATREGPHGPVTVSVSLASDGTVNQLRLHRPSAGVQAALPGVLRGQPIGRAPLIVASLDLCLECFDL